MASLHDKDDVALTFVSGSNALRAAMAPRNPANDALRALWTGVSAANVRWRLEEAARLADRSDPGQLAILLEIAKVFASTYPGEPLPFTVE